MASVVSPDTVAFVRDRADAAIVSCSHSTPDSPNPMTHQARTLRGSCG